MNINHKILKQKKKKIENIAQYLISVSYIYLFSKGSME